MVNIKLPHVVEDRDRHGNVRYYVRIRGRRKVRIRGIRGSEDFMAAYHAALDGEASEKPRSSTAIPGSLRHLCQRYFGSYDFKTSPCGRGRLVG
jgi:hypothetical protein